MRGQEHGHMPDRAATFAWLPSGDPEGPSIWTYLNAFSDLAERLEVGVTGLEPGTSTVSW